MRRRKRIDEKLRDAYIRANGGTRIHHSEQDDEMPSENDLRGLNSWAHSWNSERAEP